MPTEKIKKLKILTIALMGGNGVAYVMCGMMSGYFGGIGNGAGSLMSMLVMLANAFILLIELELLEAIDEVLDDRELSGVNFRARRRKV